MEKNLENVSCALISATEKTKCEGEKLGYLAFFFPGFFHLVWVHAMSCIAVYVDEVALYYLLPANMNAGV